MQTEMNKLFAEGGVMQEGGTVDPVSGNEVPPGAMKEEVRDDIDAKLSEGEFVFPADVVRFIGLQTLMKLRDKAKAGLQRMNEIGQMGNAEEVEDGEALFGGGEDEMDDDTFSSEIDSIMSEDGGGEEREYAKGGDVRKYAPGGYVGGEENAQLYRDAPIKGFEMVPMTNDAGQTIYIPFINGVAQLSIPAGYKVKSSGVEAPTTKPESTTTTPSEPTGGGGGDGSDVGGGTTTGSNISMTPDGAVANTVSPTVGSVVGGLLGLAFGVPVGLASNLGKSAIAQQNFIAEQEAMNVNVAIADTSNPANNEGVTTAAATPTAPGGPQGTGGAAASAAADAAAAAAAAGHSPEAQGAASQAAADATVSGASPSAAAAAGANAAAAADNGQAAEGGNTAANAAAADASATDGVSGIGPDGIGFAKGGFVSKPKKATKQKGLASRK